MCLIGCASYHKLNNQASFAEASTLVPAGLAGIRQVQEYWRPRLFSAPNDDFSQNQNPDGGLQKKTVTLKLLVLSVICSQCKTEPHTFMIRWHNHTQT